MSRKRHQPGCPCCTEPCVCGQCCSDEEVSLAVSVSATLQNTHNCCLQEYAEGTFIMECGPSLCASFECFVASSKYGSNPGDGTSVMCTFSQYGGVLGICLWCYSVRIVWRAGNWYIQWLVTYNEGFAGAIGGWAREALIGAGAIDEPLECATALPTLTATLTNADLQCSNGLLGSRCSSPFSVTMTIDSASGDPC